MVICEAGPDVLVAGAASCYTCPDTHTIHKEELQGVAEGERRRLAADLIILLLITLPACYPLLAPGIPATHDGLQHLFRFYDFDYALRGGELYPRWSPNLLFGYGNVLLNYYAPLTYYLSLPILALSGRFLLTIEIVCALSLLAGAWAMYLLGRPFLGRPGAFLSAAIYTYLPYHLADVYVRGTLGESLAFALLPAILYLLWRALQRSRTGAWALFSMGLAALLLTHNLSILLAAPAVFIFAGIWLWRRRQLRLLIPLAVSTAGAAGISAFFWLPMLGEAGAIRASRVVQDPSLVLRRLASLPDLVSPYWVYRYYPYQGTAFDHPLSRLAVIGLALALIIVVLRWRHLGPYTRDWMLACGGTLAVGLFLMTRPAAWVWHTVPGLLYLQFPWRWQLIVSLGTAGLIGAGLAATAPAARASLLWRAGAGTYALLITAGLALTSLLALPHDPLPYPFASRPLQESDVNLEGMAAYEQQLFLAAREWRDPWIFESVPAWVAVPADELILPAPPPPGASSPPAVAGLVVERHAPAELRLRLTALRPTALRLHSFYFPGWQAWVDDRPAEVYPSTPMGLLTVDVPAGEHAVTFRFGPTPARRLGTWVSLLTLAAGLGLLIRRRERRLLLALALLAGIIAGSALWRGRESTIVTPAPLWANFANQFALAGMDAHASPAGSEITLRLWWVSLAQPVRDYKFFVHVEDAAGHRWAQEDRQPVFNTSPTTRWGENELVWEYYRIPLPADAPAGEYTLYAGVYDAETLANLDLLDAAGNPQGQRLIVGSVQVTKP